MLVLCFYGFTYLRLLLATGAGIIVGIAGVVAFYHHFGALESFINLTIPSTSLGTPTGGGVSFLHAKILGYAPGLENIFTCFFGNPTNFISQGIMFDYSAALLFAGACVLALDAWRNTIGGARRLMLFVLTAAILVPPIIHLVGHYPSYYRWMSCTPLAIALPRFFEIHQLAGGRQSLRKAILAIACLAAFLGLPLRTLAILPSWNTRSPGPLEEVCSQVVKPDDVVIGDYKTYFALRPRCRLLFVYGMNSAGAFANIRDLPTNDISMLCLRPDELEDVTNRVGGRWRKLTLENITGATEMAGTRYVVDFYRRESTP